MFYEKYNKTEERHDINFIHNQNISLSQYLTQLSKRAEKVNIGIEYKPL
jgi:hypothetical protein